jgi:UMF1 family MFS transporter
MNQAKNNPKVLRSWAMYDWANSVYSLTIVSAVFPAYYGYVTEPNVTFLGMDLQNTTLYSYALSFSFLIIAILSPMLSGIADSLGRKKAFMKFFTYLGAFSCAAMYFFNETNLELGIATTILASIGFAGSLVFYNAFLPEIATPDRFDKVSAKGFSLGYIGSVILLLFNLLLISPKTFGIELGVIGNVIDFELAAKISFLTVAIWWMGFAQITFKNIPEVKKTKPVNTNLFTLGFKELKTAWAMAKQEPSLKKFLVSFFFYSMGVQTVMYLATLFGKSELHLDTGDLIFAILIIQLVAIGGAFTFSKISLSFGNIFSLKLAIAIWMGICIFTYFFVIDAFTFYIDAFIVGLVMGGIQSTSRATYAKLLPTENHKDNASFFSLYEICEKVGIVIGTFSFGLLIYFTGTMRNSVLALALYFLIGFIILLSIIYLKAFFR